MEFKKVLHHNVNPKNLFYENHIDLRLMLKHV